MEYIVTPVQRPTRNTFGICEWRMAVSQGLPLVHFSAQLEPYHHWNPETTHCVSQKVLTLSRKVYECKPLPYPGLETS